MDVLDFDAAIAEQIGEPVKFKLGGVTFECPTPFPVAPFLAFHADTENGIAIRGVTYLTGLVKPSQRTALKKAIEQSRVDTDGLFTLLRSVIERSTGNPTQPSVGSPTSRPKTGRRSKV